jgi:superfamily II DNA or RNA helicase
MPDDNVSDAADGAFQRGTLVRLVADPQRYGSFQGVVRRAGRMFGLVQTLTGVAQWSLDQIEPVPTAPEEPVTLLRDGRFSEPARLRQVLSHIRLTGRLADLIYSMEATNTEFHAHQFKPVLKMLASPTGSMLIADEVGLGKTIEAGLIWTELRARFDYRRLLIVCPKVLCTKWEAELGSKFGLDARVCSPAELHAILSDRERWSRGFVAICSLQGLKPPRGWDDEGAGGYGRAAAAVARLLRDRADDEPLLDMVVVDEAHHLRNAATQSNELAQLLRPVTQHQVFLSATPIHLRNSDLFSLLSLVDPETYRDEMSLAAILEANRPLVEAREAALRGRPVNEVRGHVARAAAHPLLAGTEKVGAILRSLDRAAEPLPRSDRARIAGELEQVNLLANTVTRTRRRDVQELRVLRNVHVRRAKMGHVERDAYERVTAVVQQHAWLRDIPAGFLLATPQRLLSSCLPAAVAHWRSHAIDVELEDEDQAGNADEEAPFEIRPLVETLATACAELPPPAELEQHDSKFSELLDELGKFLSAHPDEKAVVFSTFRPTLRYLGRRLAEAGIECETIHGDIKDRDAVLSRFETDPRIRILLSSEVGSEGIDLQFCRTIINYDLPWNPMRVEQRIGRVDRLGQSSDTVTVINLLHGGTIDDEIYSRLYDRLKICERALGGFEAVLGEEIAKLTPELLAGRLTKRQVAERIDQTSQAIELRLKLEEQLEEQAAALIAHGDHITRSIKAARDMHRWIGADDLARYIAEAFASLLPGCAIRDLDRDGLYELRLTSEARAMYCEWLHSRRLPGGGRLERDTGTVLCRLGRPPLGRGRSRSAEPLTQTHPFIRFLSGQVAETEAPRLRPAISARVARSALTKNLSLSPGHYAVVTMHWRFGGQVEQERIVYAGMHLADGAPIDNADAELLMLSAAEKGALWPTAAVEVDTQGVAERCETVLLERLAERFLEEKEIRRAEQDDRARIQLATLERRLAEDIRMQRDRVETQRQRISQGTAKGTKATAVIAMAEGKIRRLEERAAQRRSQIERSRRLTAEAEQLAAAVVEVLS